MNKNIMLVNINGKQYKAHKSTNAPDKDARGIENFTQVLATYKIAGHVVQLAKNYAFGEFVEYSLEVVTSWETEGRWAYVTSCRKLTSSANIKDIVDYVHDLVAKEKEFGKKLLNLND